MECKRCKTVFDRLNQGDFLTWYASVCNKCLDWLESNNRWIVYHRVQQGDSFVDTFVEDFETEPEASTYIGIESTQMEFAEKSGGTLELDTLQDWHQVTDEEDE